MQLIGTTTSPYVRKVRIVLAEKKIEYDFIVDTPNQPNAKIPAINPLGKVPALRLDDDTVLFDSRVIVEYIDNLSPNNKLLPIPNRDRAITKRWEALADGVCDAAVLVMLEKRRTTSQQDPQWIQHQQNKIHRSLAFMNEELGEQTFCVCNHFSLADIAVGSALAYLLFRFPEIDWQTDYPGLQRLHDKMQQRTSFADSQPSV